MRSMAHDLRVARQSLALMPPQQLEPPLVILSGLPGTGKTFFSHILEERLPIVAIRTDEIRKTLFQQPTYAPEESYWVYQVCHRLIEELLRQGVGVIFDATNLSERGREDLYAIAERTGARLVIVLVVAPEEVVRERLLGRHAGRRDSRDRSDATWEIYERMKSSVERIRRPHYVVDTSQNPQQVAERLARELAPVGQGEGNSPETSPEQ